MKDRGIAVANARINQKLENQLPIAVAMSARLKASEIVGIEEPVMSVISFEMIYLIYDSLFKKTFDSVPNHEGQRNCRSKCQN